MTHGSLGQILARYRLKRGLTQRELAELVGISRNYLALLERDVHQPSMDALKAIAAELRIPESWIVFLAVDPSSLAPRFRKVAEEVASTLLEAIDSRDE